MICRVPDNTGHNAGHNVCHNTGDNTVYDAGPQKYDGSIRELWGSFVDRYSPVDINAIFQ